jgi:hypothetical protein
VGKSHTKRLPSRGIETTTSWGKAWYANHPTVKPKLNQFTLQLLILWGSPLTRVIKIQFNF